MYGWIVVISAAIGTFVGGVITLVGQYLERKSNLRGVLLPHAIDLAKIRISEAKEFSQQSSKPVLISDHILLVETYFQWLLHLHKHGELPNDKRIQR